MRIPLLILIAIITFVIILLVNNPDIVKKFWLWAVGLSGTIVQLCRAGWEFLKSVFSKGEEMLKGKNDLPQKAIKKV